MPSIDRAMLERHLAEAERHVIQGGNHVSYQRELVARLEHDGHDTSQARDILRQFEELQSMYVADCDRLRKELGLPPV